MTTADVFKIISHHTCKQKQSFRWNRTYWLSSVIRQCFKALKASNDVNLRNANDKGLCAHDKRGVQLEEYYATNKLVTVITYPDRDLMSAPDVILKSQYKESLKSIYTVPLQCLKQVSLSWLFTDTLTQVRLITSDNVKRYIISLTKQSCHN